MNSNYELKMGVEETCKILCRKDLTASEAKEFSTRCAHTRAAAARAQARCAAAAREAQPCVRLHRMEAQPCSISGGGGSIRRALRPAASALPSLIGSSPPPRPCVPCISPHFLHRLIHTHTHTRIPLPHFLYRLILSLSLSLCVCVCIPLARFLHRLIHTHIHTHTHTHTHTVSLYLTSFIALYSVCVCVCAGSRRTTACTG